MEFTFDKATVENANKLIERDNQEFYDNYNHDFERLVKKVCLELDGVGPLEFLNLQPEKLVVRFYTKEEMREHHKVDWENNKQIGKEFEDLYGKLRRKLCDFKGDPLGRKLSEILDKIHDIFNIVTLGELRHNSFKEYLEAVRKDIKYLETEFSGEFSVLDPKLEKIIASMEKLLVMLTCWDFPVELLGFYDHKKLEIGLCMENIREEAKPYENRVDVMRFTQQLAEAVLVHELSHCVHFHYMVQRQRKAYNAYTTVKRKAVYETVAETSQWLYALKTNDANLIAWMEQYMESGVFPTWGYAGAGIVRNYCRTLNEQGASQEQKFLNKIVELSKTDWKKAYAFIEFMQEASK